ncbi:MAG: hypothetical protein IK012_00960 [Fibrobacter sp.]|uniref:LamG-like jellyroll fold domain-containing protein n=1 Tax=Fibrobacter sp. TaxID=35828 RepID=UPI0025B8BB06|nr:LamG-like jellyroll fold domain-containing protein [Fibrobacter sp.]MBR4783813.1 hypothetical protein [Fibrobacter sp.]
MRNLLRIVNACALIAGVSASIVLTACGPQLSGGISEETNTVAGVLLDDAGNAMVGISVCARHFVVDTLVYSDTTDSEGKFGFPIIREGQYGLSATKDSFAYYSTLTFDGTEQTLTAQLEKTKPVSGNFYLRPDTTTSGIKIYIPGSPWETTTDENGKFSFKNIPYGVVPLYAKSPDPVHYNNAVYIVTNMESSITFRGPMPTGLFENNSIGYDLAEQKDSDESDDSLTASSSAPSNSIVITGEERDSSELLFPLSPEYGLRSWWPMDYLANTDKDTKKVDDARGGTEGILLYGVDSLEDGPANKALALYGSDQFGVIEGERSILDSAKSLTIEAWINIEDPESKNYRRNIIGKLGFGSSEDSDVFSLALVQGECDREEVSLGFFIADGSSNSLECEDAVFVDYIYFDKWIYVTAIWDGKTSALYINGVKTAEKAVSVTQIGTSTEPIFFGKEDVNLKLDDVRLSTTAIGESDVLYRYYLKGGAK